MAPKSEIHEATTTKSTGYNQGAGSTPIDQNETAELLDIPPEYDWELETTYARIDGDIPAGPFVSDQEFAGFLKISPKTMSNRRSAQPGRYPRSVSLAGGKRPLYVRREIVMWLAREELGARGRRVYLCR